MLIFCFAWRKLVEAEFIIFFLENLVQSFTNSAQAQLDLDKLKIKII
jgi:hypothetical protein